MRLSLRVAQMLLADLETFYKADREGRLKKKQFCHHDLPCPDARPHHNVGELQKVQDVFLFCIRTVLLNSTYIVINHQISYKEGGRENKL